MAMATTGAVFSTVTVKELVAVSAPSSVTVSVIVAVPLWPVTGVTMTVRAAPEPPSTMFAFGTNVRLLEVALKPRLPGAVSTSPTVRASAAVAVPLIVVWLAILVSVGASFTAVTVTCT